MSTFTQFYYHIVFGTKYREPTLIKSEKEELFRYIWGILKNKNCHLFRINGVEDHIHILTHIPPSLKVSSLIKDIRVASSGHIKDNRIFPNFQGWQEGYGAFTFSHKEKDNLINYVKAQEEHHKKVTFKEEFINLLREHGIPFEEEYLV